MISLSISFDPLRLPTGSFEVTQRDLDSIRIGAANEMRELVSARLRTQGGRHWWHQAADRTRRVSEGDTEVIQVHQRGVRLQWLGLDPNTPKRSSLLAIPASKAISEYPRAYPNLLPIFPRNVHWPKLRGWLVQGEQGTAKRKYKDRPAGRPIMRAVLRGGRPLIVFSLVTHTSHVPHPQVVPSPGELSHVAQRVASRYLSIFHK